MARSVLRRIAVRPLCSGASTLETAEPEAFSQRQFREAQQQAEQSAPACISPACLIREPTENYDVAIVGAGPAGLSAALYAARFNRSVVVLHDNTSRAARIPLTQNAPGFDEGIAGFCAGDLVDGLDQISIAMGHGAAAATKAHNWLRTLDRKTVESVLQPAADVL